ncbi:plasma kallikrein [Gastrophryne carolinensis]
MGSTVASAFANLFMGWLEETSIYPTPQYKENVSFWGRYIDDIIMIWNGDDETALEFITILNSIFPSIKFNSEISKDYVTFLDVALKKDPEGHIITGLFTKPTDRNTLLRYESSHPRHLIENLPISQFLRILRIHSDTTTMETQLEAMHKKFRERGYPEEVLVTARRKATSIFNNEHSKRIKEERIPFAGVLRATSASPPHEVLTVTAGGKDSTAYSGMRMTLYYAVLCCLTIFTAAYADCIPGLQEDVYYQGGDFGSVFAPDAEYCQRICTFSPRCIMFSYLTGSWHKEAERFACFLKDSTTLSLNSMSAKGAVSGYSLKHCTQKIHNCFDKLFPGLDMMGTNYNISRESSVENCRKRCTDSIHCQFFTYVTDKFHSAQLRNVCYFKYSAKGTATKIRHLDNVVSGFSQKSCGKSALDCKRDMFQTTEFSGDSLQTVYAPDVGTCQKICTFYPNCLFFTYFTKDLQDPLKRNQCVLKTSKSGTPPTAYIKDDVISGFSLLPCKMQASVCPLPVLSDADFSGTVLHVEEVSGEKDCQQRCTNNIRCQFFTYKPIQSECNQNKCKCYLKMSSNGLPTLIEHGKGGISGFSLRLCKTRTVGGCGQPVDPASRIVGGKDSSKGEWPWQVSMHLKMSYSNNKHVCGGSIISNQWIVTAAHCVSQFRIPRYWIVYGGISNLSDITPLTPSFDVEKIIIHPKYIGAENGSDIALLKLKSPMSYNDHQQAICLPPRDFVIPKMCWVTGWGYTEESGYTSEVLQKAQVPPKLRPECQKSYPEQTLSDKIICAGYKEGQIDSCKGDSGGPLACEVQNTWYLTGITSWGEGCARPDKPGVYTQVTEFIDWIVQETNM